MHYSSLQQACTIIATLDAEKVFDRVNWKFLITTLERFGFGQSFINWVKILYTASSATVITKRDKPHKASHCTGGPFKDADSLSLALFTIFI